MCQISAHLVKSKKLFRLDGRTGGRADGGEWRIVLTGLSFCLARFWPVLAIKPYFLLYMDHQPKKKKEKGDSLNDLDDFMQ